MKCPKCDYLGFETGDRCKLCGYDFSLMATVSEQDDVEVDLMIELAASDTPPAEIYLVPPEPFNSSDVGRATPPHRAGAVGAPVSGPPGEPDRVRPTSERALPLFARAMDDYGDEPLIKLPVAPRPPLAVRKTPEIPRLRAVPRPARRAEPALEFSEEIEPDVNLAPEPAAPMPAVAIHVHHAGTSGAGARAAAAAIDHVILLAIDLGVLYFTLRMAGVSMADWRALPVAPLLTFLVILKLAYFCAFTAVGGQTIGKMATKIRVVTDADEAVDGARAIQRTIAAAVSALAFGLGFVPALIGADRRALHDRVAHTRVVALRSV